jgi:hypothetical protein
VARVRTASPIRVRVDNQFMLRRRANEQAHMKGATNIAQDALLGCQVRFPWVMHVQTNL